MENFQILESILVFEENLHFCNCRFYFSYPKTKGFDLPSYLVTNGDIWEIEYDAIYATELFSTQEGKEDSPFELVKMRREPIPN